MKLEEEIKLLREELKQTKEALQKALKRIEELEEIIKEKTKPSFVKEDVKEEPKKTGQKEGHVGYSRHIPERIDEIKEHKLNACSICGEQVSDTQESRERIVEDIVECCIIPKTSFFLNF